jgi:hypothetical protein
MAPRIDVARQDPVPPRLTSEVGRWPWGHRAYPPDRRVYIRPRSGTASQVGRFVSSYWIS